MSAQSEVGPSHVSIWRLAQPATPFRLPVHLPACTLLLGSELMSHHHCNVYYDLLFEGGRHRICLALAGPSQHRLTADI